MPSLSRALLKRLGAARLRPGQREVIEAVLAGRDILAIMPSGGGRSLCMQLPALQLPGTTVVVSPLLSLDAETETLRRVRRGKAEVVFATPERLADPSFVSTVQRNKVDLLVVDEAHRVSQSGHDIGAAARALGDPPLLALTATARPEEVADLAEKLGRPGMRVVDAGVYRENLRLAVHQVTNEQERFDALLQMMREQRGAGIVYTATVKAAQKLHAQLEAAGVEALLHHGKLAPAERAARQEAFMSGRATRVVATNAFGMGVDKADIRWIVHYQVPGSLEVYYQETARAGRDGREAHCVLFYDREDRRLQLFFARSRDAVRSDAERERVKRMVHYAQSALCRWQDILEYFGEPWDRPCGHCDNCQRAHRPYPREIPVPPEPPRWKAGDAVEGSATPPG